MQRILIVGNRALGGHELLDRVRQTAAAGPCRFHILVPAAGGDTAARERLDTQLTALRELGAAVEGAVIDADPFDAVQSELAAGDYDEVIVCTLPAGLSAWLHLDLVHRIQRHTDLPVHHVAAPAGLPERIAYRAVRLSIFVGESDRDPAGHGALYSEIVRRARAAGLAGATVLRGVEGYGASSVIHTTRLVTMSEDLPMVVVIIDTAERIDAFLPELDDLLTQGLVVRQPVDVIKYAGRRDA